MYVSGKAEVIEFMTKQNIKCSYAKVRTKLFNEQKKEQQRVRKALKFV